MGNKNKEDISNKSFIGCWGGIFLIEERERE